VTNQLILDLAPVPAPTFETFVPGRNRAAVEALSALAAGRATEQVVYVWGEAGSGKSHLLAAAHTAAWFARRTAFLVEYVADLDRGADETGLVAIDDVDALPGAAQVKVFDLFNRVRAAGGALVAAGTCAPARLPVREDLRTRLLSGLVFQLHALSDEEKSAALTAHAIERGIKLPGEVVAYLLRRLPRDLGTQFALLEAVDRYALSRKRPVTLALVREALAALQPPG
jgi:DnaA-homolog protein